MEGGDSKVATIIHEQESIYKGWFPATSFLTNQNIFLILFILQNKKAALYGGFFVRNFY